MIQFLPTRSVFPISALISSEIWLHKKKLLEYNNNLICDIHRNKHSVRDQRSETTSKMHWICIFNITLRLHELNIFITFILFSLSLCVCVKCYFNYTVHFLFILFSVYIYIIKTYIFKWTYRGSKNLRSVNAINLHFNLIFILFIYLFFSLQYVWIHTYILK